MSYWLAKQRKLLMSVSLKGEKNIFFLQFFCILNFTDQAVLYWPSLQPVIVVVLWSISPTM